MEESITPKTGLPVVVNQLRPLNLELRGEYIHLELPRKLGSVGELLNPEGEIPLLWSMRHNDGKIALYYLSELDIHLPTSCEVYTGKSVCGNNTTQSTCMNKATREVVCGITRIPCCDQEKCRHVVIRLAQSAEKANYSQ
jgi:hypothetical protein